MELKFDKPFEETSHTLFRIVGFFILRIVSYMGELTVLGVETFRSLFRFRFPLKSFFQSCEFVGVRSFNIVGLISVFTGMVLALQFSVGLSRFGLENYVGQVIGLAIVRELGPVMTCLMLAARVGSGIAAELGSMVVTEQILAIEALGANPVHKLVLPRILATTLAAPVLTVFGDLIGIIGGMWIATMQTGVTSRFFLDQVQRTVKVEDFFSGITKTLFFGFFIGLISCHQGLKTSGGTEGVGKATTYSVVLASLMVFVADFFLTKLFLVL